MEIVCKYRLKLDENWLMHCILERKMIIIRNKKCEDPKGVFRAVNLRSTDYTIVKGNGTEGRKNNDKQNITQKTKHRATQTPLKNGNELGGSGRVDSSCSTCNTRHVTLVTLPLLVQYTWILYSKRRKQRS